MAVSILSCSVQSKACQVTNYLFQGPVDHVTAVARLFESQRECTAFFFKVKESWEINHNFPSREIWRWSKWIYQNSRISLEHKHLYTKYLWFTHHHQEWVKKSPATMPGCGLVHITPKLIQILPIDSRVILILYFV